MPLTIKRLSLQSWFELKADGLVAHVDPAYYGSAARGHVQYDKANIVLATHKHPDHCDPAAIKDIWQEGALAAGPKPCAKALPGNAHAITPGEEISYGGVKICATYAYTIGIIRHLMHKKGDCVGYLITMGGKTVYHAGDTDFIPEMSSLGHVDVALLPIGGTMTMNAEGATRAAVAIAPKTVVPMHQRRSHPEAFKEAMIAAAPDIEVVLLGPGDEITL